MCSCPGIPLRLCYTSTVAWRFYVTKIVLLLCELVENAVEVFATVASTESLSKSVVERQEVKEKHSSPRSYLYGHCKVV